MLGIVISFNELQFENEPSPIKLTLSGIMTLVNFSHPENAFLAIDVSDLGNSIFTMLRSSNAPSLISVTVSAIFIIGYIEILTFLFASFTSIAFFSDSLSEEAIDKFSSEHCISLKFICFDEDGLEFLEILLFSESSERKKCDTWRFGYLLLSFVNWP